MLSRPVFAPLVLAPLVVTGCVSPDSQQDGTAVGNPGVVAFALGQPTDLTVEEGEAFFTSGTVSPCGSGDAVALEELDESVSIEDGEIAFDLPAGTWCTMSLAGLEVGASGLLEADPDDGAWSMGLDVGELTLNAPSFSGFRVNEEQVFVLELGAPGWFDATRLEAVAGEEVFVEPGDDAHDGLAADIAAASALFDDADGDGDVSAAERTEGSSASAANDEPQASGGETEESGAPACSVAPGVVAPWMFLVVGLLLPRRHRP